MTTNHKMRRLPKQSRGQQRIEKILDATESLLCEMDFDKITTNHIAQKANTSVGVMYRYFPNKYAVFAGLAERDRAYLTEIQSECLIKCSRDDWQQYVCAFVDQLASHYRSSPAYHILWAGIKANTSTSPISCDLMEALAKSHQELSRHLTPNVSDEMQPIVSSVIVNLIQSQLTLAIKEGEKGDCFFEAIMDECKCILMMYMGRLINQSGKKHPFVVIKQPQTSAA